MDSPLRTVFYVSVNVIIYLFSIILTYLLILHLALLMDWPIIFPFLCGLGIVLLNIRAFNASVFLSLLKFIIEISRVPQYYFLLPVRTRPASNRNKVRSCFEIPNKRLSPCNSHTKRAAAILWEIVQKHLIK